MLCLEEEAAPVATAGHVRRAVSETGPGLLADVLRVHLAEHLAVEPPGAPLAGLPRLRLPESDRRTFVLPDELVRLEVVRVRVRLSLSLSLTVSLTLTLTLARCSVRAASRTWRA